MKRITAAQRDAIIADVRELLRRHGISPYSLGKFARIAGAEAAADERTQIGIGLAMAQQAGRAL